MVFSDIGFKPEQKSSFESKNNLENKNSQTGFDDVPNESWIAPYTKKALELNIIPPPNISRKFEPNRAITKLEALKMAFIIEGIYET